MDSVSRFCKILESCEEAVRPFHKDLATELKRFASCLRRQETKSGVDNLIKGLFLGVKQVNDTTTQQTSHGQHEVGRDQPQHNEPQHNQPQDKHDQHQHSQLRYNQRQRANGQPLDKFTKTLPKKPRKPRPKDPSKKLQETGFQQGINLSPQEQYCCKFLPFLKNEYDIELLRFLSPFVECPGQTGDKLISSSQGKTVFSILRALPPDNEISSNLTQGFYDKFHQHPIDFWINVMGTSIRETPLANDEDLLKFTVKIFNKDACYYSIRRRLLYVIVSKLSLRVKGERTTQERSMANIGARLRQLPQEALIVMGDMTDWESIKKLSENGANVVKNYISCYRKNWLNPSHCKLAEDLTEVWRVICFSKIGTTPLATFNFNKRTNSAMSDQASTCQIRVSTNTPPTSPRPVDTRNCSGASDLDKRFGIEGVENELSLGLEARGASQDKEPTRNQPQKRQRLDADGTFKLDGNGLLPTVGSKVLVPDMNDFPTTSQRTGEHNINHSQHTVDPNLFSQNSLDNSSDVPELNLDEFGSDRMIPELNLDYLDGFELNLDELDPFNQLPEPHPFCLE